MKKQLTRKKRKEKEEPKFEKELKEKVKKHVTKIRENPAPLKFEVVSCVYR